jgi:hypothetical protein
MTGLNSIYSHSSSIVTRKAGNEYVLVPLTNNIADMNRIYTLNDTGAFIWELINGKRNVIEIISALVQEYDIDREKAERDVYSFIDQLSEYLIVT